MSEEFYLREPRTAIKVGKKGVRDHKQYARIRRAINAKHEKKVTLDQLNKVLHPNGRRLPE